MCDKANKKEKGADKLYRNTVTEAYGKKAGIDRVTGEVVKEK